MHDLSILVMAGQKREARLRADVPAIHVFTSRQTRTWMPRIKSGHDGKQKLKAS
jgi:hypothetical protein